MKRTVLDIEGVFSHESMLPRPDSMFGAKFETTSENSTSVDVSDAEHMPVTTGTPKLDMSQVAGGLDLAPEQIEEILRGVSKTPAKKVDSQNEGLSLPVNVLTQLSAEDRAALSDLGIKQ